MALKWPWLRTTTARADTMGGSGVGDRDAAAATARDAVIAVEGGEAAAAAATRAHVHHQLAPEVDLESAAAAAATAHPGGGGGACDEEPASCVVWVREGRPQALRRYVVRELTCGRVHLSADGYADAVGGTCKAHAPVPLDRRDGRPVGCKGRLDLRCGLRADQRG